MNTFHRYTIPHFHTQRHKHLCVCVFFKLKLKSYPANPTGKEDPIGNHQLQTLLPELKYAHRSTGHLCSVVPDFL